MRLTIEIAAAALLVICISVSSAAFAAGKTGRSADGLSCSFSVAAKAPRPPRAAPRSSGNAAENSTPIIAATRCCRRCEDAAILGIGSCGRDGASRAIALAFEPGLLS